MPYFQIDSIVVGPLTIQFWGLMVALGVLAGLWLSCYLAKRYFFTPNVIVDITIWALIAGLVGARVFYICFYALDYFLAHPLDVFKVWQGGLSSLGGFFGATIAIWLFAKKRCFSYKELLPYLDVGVVGLWLGWGIGRLGCFAIHDHLGRLTHFFLAVNFPSGARFDLGLLDSLLGFFLFIIFISLFKYLVQKKWGLVTILSVFSYALVRFFLDFLRATDLTSSDARYFYLTPAQWGTGIVVLGLTIWLVLGKIRQTNKCF